MAVGLSYEGGSVMERCENCGCIMEKSGCPSCDEIAVNNEIDERIAQNENVYEHWKG